jgi:hypothetical protein
MPFAGTFTPGPDPGAAEPFSIDFSAQIAEGDSIVSATATLTELNGIDPTPSGCIISPPIISGTVVTQQLGGAAPGGFQAGSLYVWEVVVTTAQGSVLPNFAHIPCEGIG